MFAFGQMGHVGLNGDDGTQWKRERMRGIHLRDGHRAAVSQIEQDSFERDRNAVDSDAGQADDLSVASAVLNGELGTPRGVLQASQGIQLLEEETGDHHSGYRFLRRPRRFLWGSQSWLLPAFSRRSVCGLPEQFFEPSGYPLIVFLPPIRDEKDPAERKEHASGCAGRVVRPERLEVIGRKALAIGIRFENLQEGPQSGAPVPLDDGLRIRKDVEILGGPQVQARGAEGQHVVVKLQLAMVPLARWSFTDRKSTRLN